MVWVRLDDKRALNPKLTAAGFAARGLDEAAICLSASLNTDAKVTRTMLATLAVAHGTSLKAALGLVDLLLKPGLSGGPGRWEPAEDGDGWMIHDYHGFNPKASDVKEQEEGIRQARRAAGRRGGLKSGESRRRTKPEANGKQSASSKGEASDMKQPSSNGSNPRPDPSASNEAETGRDALPPEGRRPPRQNQPPPPVSVNALEARRAEAEARAADCGRCDHGWVHGDDGTVARCPCQDPKAVGE